MLFVPARMICPWPVLAGVWAVIWMSGKVSGLAAVHIGAVAVPERPTVKVPALIRTGWPGRLPGPAHQHS